MGFYRTPDRSFPHVLLHLIFTNTVSPFSQKKPLARREAELGFQHSSVWTVWSLGWNHDEGRNFLSRSLLGHPHKNGVVNCHTCLSSQTPSTVLHGLTCRQKGGGGGAGDSSDVPVTSLWSTFVCRWGGGDR